MTDTGRFPGEGQPENAGATPGHPLPADVAAPADTGPRPSTYSFLDPGDTADEDDLLLMPGAQGAWMEQPPAQGGTHEPGGRDTGPAGPDELRTPPSAPRRPLHMGPPVPDNSNGVVRSLADRGPATSPQPVGSPVPQPAVAAPAPESLDVPRTEAEPVTTEAPQPDIWDAQPQQAPLAEAPAPLPEAPVREHAPVDETPAVGPAVAFVPAQNAGGAPATGEPAADHAIVAQEPSGDAPQAPGTAEPEAQSPAPHETLSSVPQMRLPADATAEIVSDAPAARPQAVAVATAESAPAPGPARLPAVGTVSPADAEAPAEPAETLGGTTPAVAPALTPAAPPAPAVTSAPEPAPQERAAATPAPEPITVSVPGSAQQEQPAAPAVPEPARTEPGPLTQPAAPAPAVADAPAAPVASQPQGPDVVPLVESVPAARAVPEQAETSLPEAPPPAAPVVAAPHSAPAEQETRTTPTETVEPPAPAVPPAVADAVRPDSASGTDGTAPAMDTTTPAPPQEPAPALEFVRQDEPRSEAPVPATAPTASLEPLGPPAVGYDEAERAAVHRVMRERRDIRNGFRTDPIPHDVLLRVLEAAHTAPSVGHSQPWDFVVIRSAETRQTVHRLAARQRQAYADSLPKARAKQFKELKIEAILDTPVNIVVTADPTRGGRHTLGRHSQPQMAPYSSALAVENLWLAARAEGLGVGWVSFFDERELVRELDLPEHLEIVAYLCIGYVDEFPDEPELMQAGWSKRRPLSWVVHEETYGRRALPGEDPHDLLAETLRGIRPLDAKALGEAWERQKRMTKPSGALGMLEIISAQLCGLSRKCPPPIPEPAAVAIFAGDHGVHAQGVTAWPQEVTSQMVANFLGGGAVCNAFANQVGAEVCIVDVGVAADLPATPGLLPRKVRPGTGDFTAGPAMSREEALRAIEVGIETARDLVTAGNKALLTGEMGIANTTVSAALISVYTGADPAEVTGRGTGINDEMHACKIDVVRRALELHRPDPEDPIGVLAAVGGLEHAALVGLILGGASLRTPVILDGVSAGAAALVARAIAPEALAACIAGHRSAEPGHVAALTKLGLRPLVDLDLRLGEGTGALLALPVVQSAARAMHEVATFDTAGVTEKS